VKFKDFLKTNKSESICQVLFHWSRTKVRGSKTIRYRRSLNYKRYHSWAREKERKVMIGTKNLNLLFS